jgi:hypothetical protein
VQQHLDASIFSAVVRLSLSAGDVFSKNEMLVRLLACSRPAAQHLAVQDVAALLRTAVQRRDVEARTQVSKARAACSLAWGCIVYILCRLPAAQQLRAADALLLLQADAETGALPFKTVLFDLPAARQLSGDDVMALLNKAVLVGNTGFIAYIVGAGTPPAVQQLDSSTVDQLLHDAEVRSKELESKV